MSYRRAGAWGWVLVLLLALLPSAGGPVALASGPAPATVASAVYGASQPAPAATAPDVVAGAVYAAPQLTLAAAAPDVIAGGGIGVAGTLLGADGSPVSGGAVALTASAGAFQQATVTTDVYGRFDAVFNGPTTAAGLTTLTAAAGPAVASATLSVTAGPAPAVSLNIAPADAAAGAPVAISGEVAAGDGSPVVGAAVDVQASAGTPATTTVHTGAGGAYQLALTAPAATGPVLIQVAVPSLGVSAAGVVIVTAAPPTGASAAFSLGGGAVAGGAGTPAPDVTASAAGGTGAVAVAQYGTGPPAGVGAMPGASLYFSAGLSANSTFTGLTLQACGATAGASVSWWSGGAWTPVSPEGQVGSCLFVGPLTGDGTTSPSLAGLAGGLFAIAGLAVDPTQSTVSAGSATVPADGVSLATIDVTLVDSQGDPVSGKTVTLNQDPGASSLISAASGPSSASGDVSFTVTDAVAETVIYTATDATDGITLDQTALVTFGTGVSSAAGVPTVTAVSPASGPAGGGTTVTISGSGFTDADGVYFGDAAAASFNVVSDGEVTAVSPQGTAGDTVDITVDAPNGTSEVVTADEFTYATAAPTTGSATVSSSGGTLATPDGAFSMSVPPGALAAGESLTVTESCAAPSGIPAAFVAASCVFMLSGGALATPQTATLAFQAAPLAGLPASRISIYAQSAGGNWAFVPTAVDAAAGTASATLPGLGTFVALAATTRLADVAATDWAAPDIDTLLAAGVAAGYPGGTFDPSRALTRAEFVKMLALTLRLPAAAAPPHFADVPASSWFAPFVAEAVTAGVVKGVTASDFDPNAPLTRQDAAVALTRALRLTGGGPLTFADAGQVAQSAVPAVEAAVAAGYLAGFPDGTLRPLQPMTRAQAAKVLATVIRHEAP